ncbi:tyrosine-type recombinase/integrase [Lysobacter sp. CA199]|uniref:tyrosine-type recombinase/integrase n=1 Tax=Lysobacter sp. CA199 TaxID=3455608 RepID=UPI003F8D5B45
MALTDLRIRQAKAGEKPYRLADGGGMFLEVRPNGAKFFRYAYRIDKKPNLYAIGGYPEKTLLQAREEHVRARAHVKAGRHPAHERARERREVIQLNKETFKATAEEWFKSKRTIPAEGPNKGQRGWSASHEDRTRRYLDKDIYPKLDNMALRSIKTVDVAGIVKAMEKRGAPVAALIARQIVSQVFVYAISDGRADFDPAYIIRRTAKRRGTKVVHKTPLRPSEIRVLSDRLSAFKKKRVRVIAILLLLHTFIRGKELRTTPWAEVLPALDSSLWVIPGERMKMGRTHLVPLSPQVVELLKELHALTGDGEYLFPHSRKAGLPMGYDGVNYVLRELGYPRRSLTGHAFRATASTLLNEMDFRLEHVDMQLAHASGDAYNHARYLRERTKMMKVWSNFIDKIARGEDVEGQLANEGFIASLVN